MTDGYVIRCVFLWTAFVNWGADRRFPLQGTIPLFSKGLNKFVGSTG